jgi:hypothetical protein
MALDWSESAVVETMPGKISGAQTISIHAPLELVRFRKRGTHSAGVGRLRSHPAATSLAMMLGSQSIRTITWEDQRG